MIAGPPAGNYWRYSEEKPVAASDCTLEAKKDQAHEDTRAGLGVDRVSYDMAQLPVEDSSFSYGAV